MISDFGECEDLDETHQENDNRTGATGTLEFMAPEHVRLDPRGRNTVDYSPKADMWSLGMVLYYLCYSKLPYSVIDDVDILRKEILEFRDVRFPISRFDIYKSNPVLYAQAMNDPNLQSDIPSELKLLIRMLLSIDPNKRPSCNKILSKLRSIQTDDNKTTFQDMPSDWNSNNNNSSSSSNNNNINGSNIGSQSTASDSQPNIKSSPTRPTATIVDENEEQRARSTSPTKRANSNTNSGSSDSLSNIGSGSNTSLRKRQRLLENNSSTTGDSNHVDNEGDTVMREVINEENSPRLLLESPDIIQESSASRLTDKQMGNIIKTVTAILKVKIN